MLTKSNHMRFPVSLCMTAYMCLFLCIHEESHIIIYNQLCLVKYPKAAQVYLHNNVCVCVDAYMQPGVLSTNKVHVR